jgi:hypothetical protein
MQISFLFLRECPVSPENGPAVVLSNRAYQEFASASLDLVNENALEWSEWASTAEVDNHPAVVFGFEPSAFFDAGMQSSGHVLVRWCYAPSDFRFPSSSTLEEMKELCPPCRISASEKLFVLADPIDLRAGKLDLGVQSGAIVVRTFEYTPASNARFVVHVIAAEVGA